MQKYESAELEILESENIDILTDSGIQGGADDDEL